MTDNHRDDPNLLDAIEEFVMNSENIGIDPQIFHILDDVESSEEEIASMEYFNLIGLGKYLRVIRCQGNRGRYAERRMFRRAQARSGQ